MEDLRGKVLFMLLKKYTRTSLVVEWIGIHLPVTGTRVRSLVQEDPTCHGASEPRATTTEPARYSY